MASRMKVTVTLDKALVQDLVGASRRMGKPKSRLVEEALTLWRRSLVEQEMKEGYLAMAKENREAAERSMAATWEVVK